MSAFAPLRHRAFAVLWLAALVGNTGMWMRDVGLVWLMTDVDPRPWLVAAVQASAALPVFLLALPAGALTDVLDRRRLLFAAQFSLMLVSALLAVLTWAGVMTPALIILLTLTAGIGAAISNPAWQTIIPQLVPREDLRAAVALNSMGFNISRAIGPAMGGAVVAVAGVASAFVLDVLSFVGILAALLWWRPAVVRRTAPPEALVGAMRAGLRYAWNSMALRRVLLRVLLFFIFGAAPWALLPLVARQGLGGDAGLYGLLLGAVGAGAVAGALLLPTLQARLGGGDGVLAFGGVAVGIATLMLGVAPSAGVAMAACGVLGTAWIAALTSLNVAAQSALPDWVRGRGIALYLMVFSGGMVAGSMGWGVLAQYLGRSETLALAGLAGLATALLLRPRLRLPPATDGMAASDHMPGHEALADAPGERDGPVVVLVEYRLRQPEDRAALLGALAPLEAVRRRDGARAWWMMTDPEDRTRVLEMFEVADWAEHERMHARATQADRALHAAANAWDLHGAPRLRHLVGARHG